MYACKKVNGEKFAVGFYFGDIFFSKSIHNSKKAAERRIIYLSNPPKMVSYQPGKVE